MVINYSKKNKYQGIWILKIILIIVFAFPFNSTFSQVKPSFSVTNGPTILPGSNPTKTIGAKYIYQNVATVNVDGNDYIIDAILTIVDIKNSKITYLDKVNGVDARFEPETNNTSTNGYVEWEMEFVYDGTVVNANDKGVGIHLKEFTLEAIDVDGDEWFEAIVTNSYTLENQPGNKSKLVVTQKPDGYTRFSSTGGTINGVSTDHTEYIVRIDYKDVDVISFRNGRVGRGNRYHSLGFQREVIFDLPKTVNINSAPRVTDKVTGLTIQDTQNHTLDLFVGAEDDDGNIDKLTLHIMDPDQESNQGVIGTPLIISGQGTYTLVDMPGAGVNVTFTPESGFHGLASILFFVDDDLGVSSNRATYSVTVNDTPIASDDLIKGDENTTISANLITGDNGNGPDVNNSGALIIDKFLIEGDSNEYDAGNTVVLPGKGEINIDSDGSFLFTPLTGQTYNGTIGLSYKVSDGLGGFDTASVVLGIRSVNQAPVAVGHTVGTELGLTVKLYAAHNDSDPDGTLDNSTVDLDPATPGIQKTFSKNGTWTVDSHGHVSYNPANTGTTFINYTINDNNGATSNVAQLTVITNEASDADGDGVPDKDDLDSDNDGILNTQEGFASVTPSNPKSTYTHSQRTVAAQSGTGISTPTNGYIVTDQSTPGKFAFKAVSRSETGNGGGIGTKSYVTIDVNFAPLEYVNNVKVSFKIGSQSSATGNGYFDEGFYIEINNVVVVNFNYLAYNGVSAFNAKFDIDGGNWAPWNGEGNPELVLDLQNRTVKLMADTKAGGREDALPFMKASAKPNPMPAVDFEAGVTIGTAYNNESGPGGIGYQTLNFSADVKTHRDTDGDGTFDFISLDTDNDGCFDVDEVYGKGVDTNGNGQFGATPTLSNGGVNSNGLVIAANLNSAGTAYTVTPPDRDNNGTQDYRQSSKSIIGITAQPLDVTSTIDNDAVFSVDFDTSAIGTEPIVQWYTKKGGTGSEVALIDSGTISGPTTNTLTVSGFKSSNSGDVFYAKITSPSFECDTDLTTTEAVLTVTPHPINIVNDTFTVNRPRTIVTTGSVLDNDLFEGVIPITEGTTKNTTLTYTGGTNNTIGLNHNNGTIVISGNIPAGIYEVYYKICEDEDPTNCATGTAIVTVLADTDLDGVADINDLDDDNDGVLDTVEGTCVLPSQMRLGYIPNSRDLDSDDGYTIDGKNMTGLKSKIENPANFGPSGTVKTEIILVPITANPITKADLDALNLDAVFIGGIDKVPAIESWLSSTEFSAIKTWSTDPSKTVIVTQASSTQWGRTLVTGNANPDKPNTIGAATSIFNGPFGKVTQFNQGGSFQAVYTADPSKNDAVLALDKNNERVIIKDGIYNDILLSDVDILTTIGGISNGSSISNDNDKLALNLIYTAIPLSSCPGTDIDLDGVSNSLDLDSDGDGCNDVIEAYGLGNDADGDGVFGSGTPVVDADGKVIGASYATPADLDSNGIDDFKQISQKLNGVTTQPVNQIDKLITDTATFTVTPDISGTGTAFIYQWEEKKQGASTWTPLVDGANYAGSSTRTLTVSNLQTSQSGNLYRAVITSPSYSCDTEITSSSAQLTIKSHDIVTGADSMSFVEKGTGQVIADILSNDLVNGVGATVSNVTITLLGNPITGLTLNTTTGEVNTDGTLTPGTYTLEYQLCEIVDFTNCTTIANKGVITITILKDSDGDLVADIDDLDDDNDGIFDTVEDAVNADVDNDGIINSLDTDSDNDGCSDTKEVYGAATDFGVNPAVDANGLVIVAGVSGNSYTTLPTDNDNNGTWDFKQASKSLVAITDQPADHISNINKPVTFVVKASTQGTGTEPTYQWQEQPSGGVWSDISDNANFTGTTTNTLIVTPNSSAFNGNLYRVVISTPSYICDSDITSNEGLIILNSHVINANPDNSTIVEKKALASFINVLTNDLVDHAAALIANVTLTQVSTSNAGITLNTTTGEVSMTSAVTEGIYFLEYTICENIDPTNCTNGTVTVVVQKDTDLDGIPDVTDPDIDGDGNGNATDPNPNSPVANNDIATVKVGVATEIDLLMNDDFIAGANTAITQNGGTATGTIAFNNLTGKLTYTPTLAEAGTDVTVIYEVTNIPTSVSASATVTISVDDEADLSIALVVDKSAPNVGDNVIFTITVSNSGPSNATNVDVNSLLPTGFTYVSSTPSAGTYNSTTGNWFVGSINNGANENITITATVNATGPYAQVAEITFSDQDDPDSTPANGNSAEDDYATTTVVPVAQSNLVTILTVNNATPNEGDEITYQIKVTNNGPSDATNVTITSAALPTGITYTSDDGAGAYVHGTGVWTIGNLAAGSNAILHVVGAVNTGQAGNTINSTIAASLTETDPTTTGDILTTGVTVNQAALTTTIAVDNTAPNEGDTIKYTINIVNGGANSASGIALTTILPSGVTYVSDNGGGTYNSATGIWNPATLANGANVSLEITSTVNSGTAGTTISTGVTKINTDQSLSNTLPVTTADITIKSVNLVTTNMVDNTTPNEGSTIKYTLTVTNSGTDTATNVIVTDLLPTGVTYVSDNGAGAYLNGTGVWTIGSIVNGAVETLEITATVDSGTAGSHITNTISSVSSTETDSNTSGDILASTISITSANLVTVLSIPNTTPNVNDLFSYTITVTNNGPGNATDVSLTNLVPNGLNFVSSSNTNGGTYVNGTGIWTVGDLTNGASATLTVNTTVNTDQGNQLITVNTTAASGNQTDSTTAGDILSQSLTPTSANLITNFSVNNPNPTEGETIIFTIKVRNAGPSDETNVSLTTDNWPITGATFVSDDGVGAYVNSTGIWTLGNIASGATSTLNITAIVDSSTGGNSYTFKSINPASGDQVDPTTNGDILSTSINVQSAKLATSISVDNPSPNVGSTVTYLISVVNNGPSTDNNINLTSLIPTGLTYVSANPSQGTFNNGSGIWNIGSIANGITATLKIEATVDVGQGGNTINSTTSAALGDHTDTSITNPNLSTSITVTSANLITVKSVNNTLPDEGDTIIYSIKVTNNGPNDESNVSLTDLLPTGVTYVSETVSKGTYTNGTGLWSIGNIANGDSETLLITATVDAGTSGTTITNTTTAATGDQSDPTTSGDVLTSDITITSSDILTVLSVSNTTPNEGDTIVYTLNVTNNGPNDDTNVTLTTAILSALSGVTFISDDSAGTYVPGTGVWTIGAITSGNTKTLNITATVDAGTGGSTITNTTTAATGDQGDPSTLGDVLSTDITVTSANLITTISVDNANPDVGDNIIYTIYVNNNGPNNETNVTLEDHLPSGITFVSATTSNGSYSNATGVWTIGSIPKYNTVKLELTGTVDIGKNAQTITNTIVNRATGDQSDPTTAGDNLSSSITVSSANLITTISVDNPTPNEGDAVIYTLKVRNNGPNSESNINLTSLLPTGINFTSATPTSGSYSQGTGLWNIGNLAANTSTTLLLVGNVDTGAALLGNITTSTTAAVGNIADGDTTGDVLSANIIVTQADLITKISISNTTPNEGDTVQVKISVTNNGPNNETNTSLTSILPSELTYLSDNSGGVYNSATGLWTIGNITKNSSKNIILQATVKANTGGQNVLVSTTKANGDQTDPDNTTDVLSTSMTIGNSADIVLGKTVDNFTPNEGDIINYNISVTNKGPTNVTNLVINDVLPSGLTFVNEFAGTGVWNTAASTWTLNSLASGVTKNLTLQVSVNTGTGGNIITNTITNTQDQIDSNATVDDNTETITVTDTDLYASISVDNPTPNEGDIVKYSISISNSASSSLATNVSLTNILPNGLTYINSTTTNGTFNSGSGLWSVGSLNNGANAMLIIDAKVDTGTGGTTISNTISSPSADQSDSNTTADTLTALLTVTSTDLVTTKTVDVSNPTEGQDIIYTITVTNSSGSNATNVKLTDRLPIGVTYKNDDVGTYSSTSGIWTIGNITAGTSKTINITANVDSGTGNTTITNTTTAASGDQSDPTTVGDDLTETINVVSSDLVTTNTVNVTQANIGDTVTYTLTVTNNGPSTATSINLIDQLPTGVTYVSDTGSGAYISGTGVWTIGSLANGASATIDILATVDTNSGGKTISNVISQTANATEVDPTTANDILSAVFDVISNDLETSLTVDKLTPNEGDAVIYTLTVKNDGPSIATGVSITDNLPAGVTYTSHSTINGTFNSGAGIWSIGTLAKNATATLTINGTIDIGTGGQTLVNTTSSATADFNDQNTANNSDSTSLTVGNLADVVVTNTVDNSTPNVGDTVTFTVTATNNGPTKVSNLIISNSLPTGLTYGLITPSNGTWTSPNWAIGSLDSGKTETITIQATVNAGTGGQHLTNTVSNTQTQTDSNLVLDDFDETITVTSVDLVTTKTVNNSNPNEGDSIIYTIAVTNNGPNDATNVSLTDILPTGVTYINDDASGSYNVGSGVWTIGSIANGSTTIINITATVDNGTGGTSIVNVTTKAIGDQTDPTTVGDDLTESISVSSSELVTTLSVDNANPVEGETITYSLKVNNQGTNDASNINLVSILPSGVTFDSFIAPPGTTFNSGSGNWTINSLTNHSTVTLSISATVDIGTGGSIITNTTTAATGDQSDPNNVPDILSIPITVSNTSDIVITKTVNDNTPNVGDVITYTITVTNKQGAHVDNLVLKDVLPNGLTYGVVTPSTGTWSVPNWNIGNLAVGNTESITVQAIVSQGMGGNSLTNTVSHSQTQTDSNITSDDLSETITVTSADLITVKTVDNVTPNEGDTITYSILVTNNGLSDATGVQLIDNLPIGITYNSPTVTSGSYNVGSGIWTIGDLTSGSSATFIVNGTINSGTGGTTITNTTSAAKGDQSDPTTSGDVLTASLTVTSTDLITVKTVDNTSPNEGDIVMYTITTTNNGVDGATNVSLIDILPTGVTYLSDDASGDYDSITGIWSIGNLVANEVRTLNITTKVNNGTGGSTITNTTTAAKGDQSDPTSVGDSLSATINVTNSDLVTTISVDNSTPNEGDDITYLITVVNNGPNDATNVILTDVLPIGITYVSDNGTGAYNSSTGDWTIGAVSSGTTHTLRITANINSGTGGSTIVNTIIAAKGNESDPTTVGDQLTASLTVTIADLITIKSVNTSSVNGNTFEGEIVTYTITVFNNGSSNATNVSLTDNLPVGVTYLNHNTAQGVYNNGSGHWAIGSISNGDTATLTVSAIVNSGTSGTTITNTTTKAMGDQSDSTDSGNILSADLIVSNTTDIVMTKVVDNSTPNIGDTITYTITASNRGPALITNLIVSDALPTGLTYGIVTPSVGTWNSPNWTIGSLASGSTATITIQGIVGLNTGGQILINTITKTHDQIDSDATVDDLDESITVTSSELITTKIVTSNNVEITSANEGDTVSYIISVENNGPNDATNVSLTDLLPTGVTYVSDDSNGSYNTGSGLWSIGTISDGAKATLNLIATVNANTSGQTITNNTTAATGDQSDPNNVVDDLDASFTVKSESDIVLTKTVDNAAPNEGDTVTYTITVTNSSGATATNLVVTDALPNGLLYGVVTPSQGTWTMPNWNVGSLSPGQTAIITIQAVVDFGTQGLTLVNTISNTQDQTDINASQDDTTASISVTSADLEVTKTVSNQSPNEGDAIIYTIIVENKGPNHATGVYINDVLPTGVTYVGHFTNEGTYNQGSGLWDIGNIANTDIATLTINVTVDNGTTHNNITNTTTSISADQADPNTSNNIGEVTITPGSSIDLSLTKNVIGNNLSPKVGDIITFEIVLANAGPNLATGIEVTDLLPSGLKFVKYNSSSTYDSVTGIWNVGSLNKNNNKILFIDAEVLPSGDYTNCTEVTKADQVDVDSSPNNGITTEDDYSCVILTPESQSDLEVSSLVVGNNLTPKVGDNISFEVILKNNGPINATNVELTNAIPSGYSFISATSSNGVYNQNTGLWSINKIIVGDSETLNIIVQVNAVGIYENCSEITKSDQIDSDLTNNKTCLTTTPISIADLELNIEVNENKPLVNTNVQFTVTLTNNGPSNANNIEINALVPSGYKFVSSTTTNGTFDENSGFWNINNISNNSSEKLTVIATVLNIGNWIYKTEITKTDEFDPDSTPNNGDINEDDYVDVEVSPNIIVTIPQTFSPNGDGINETFEIPNLHIEYPKYSIVIVNRYGYKVFSYKHNGNPNNKPISWDGRSTGNMNVGNGLLPAGTYFYTVHFNDGIRKPQTGWIYLRR